MSRFVYIRDSSKELGKGHSYHSSVVSQRLAPFEAEAKRDVVIIDSLRVSTEQVQFWRDTTHKLVLFNCIDNIANQYADVSVTPDVSLGFQNACCNCGHGVHFRGPRYWFLRDEFYEPAEAARPWYEVGVMIGGTDPLNITEQIQEQLRSVLVVHGTDIASQMRMCRLMLTGCGQSFWESLAVGTPAIPFAANEAQAKQYGSVFRLGNVADIRGMIERREWVNPDPAYEIGRGWQEVIEEIIR